MSENNGTLNKNKPVLIGQDVQINKSLVKLNIIDIFTGEDGKYILKARVLEVFENDAYPSIAVAGDEYTLTPAFELNENNEPVENSDRNKRLLSISGRSGIFNAEIYFEKMKGWFIRDLITE